MNKNQNNFILQFVVILFAIILVTKAFFVIVAKDDIGSLLKFVGLLLGLITAILKSTKN